MRSCSSLADLPAGADVLFAVPGRGSLFATRAWFECVIATAMPPGTVPHFVTLALAGRIAAMVPMRLRHRPSRMDSLTTPYSCEYAPLLAEGLSGDALVALGAAFGGYCRRWPLVRLDALACDDPAGAAFLAATRRAARTTAAFAHFGNWHEAVAGIPWSAWLRARPGRLRETIRRKLARAEADPATGFEMLTEAADAPRAIAVYQDVYARSWKPAEPFADFNPALIARAAGCDMLRLGVLRARGVAVAVQLWVVSGGVATLLKLAHDEAARALSPGTVLTAMMIRHLLDQERVLELDFGRGDDRYKQDWVTHRRERAGLVLINPLHPAGLAFAARHVAGRLLRAARRG